MIEHDDNRRPSIGDGEKAFGIDKIVDQETLGLQKRPGRGAHRLVILDDKNSTLLTLTTTALTSSTSRRAKLGGAHRRSKIRNSCVKSTLIHEMPDFPRFRIGENFALNVNAAETAVPRGAGAGASDVIFCALAVLHG